MSTNDSPSVASGTPGEQDAVHAADALWQFVTSVKSVRKGDGGTEPFRLETLERSIVLAFRSVQKEEDAFTINNLMEQIYVRLQTAFDGIVTPTTTQIREIVLEILRSHDTNVAAAYERGDLPKTNNKTAPSAPPLPKPEAMPTEPVGTLLATKDTSHAPRRRRLSDERKAITHKFQVGGHEGYLTVGLYDDGQPGEIFLKMSKEGTVMSGLMDSFATAVSIGLQYGVPLNVLVNKFADVKYEPNGPTSNPNIPVARSIVDYIFRYFALKFLSPQERQSIGLRPSERPFLDPSLPETLNVDGLHQPSLSETSHSV